VAQEALLHFDIKRHIALCLEIRHCTMPLEAILYVCKKKRYCIVKHYTIMALGRGEYPKLSTPLGLFPRNNPSGVDNFEYSPIQRAVTVLLYRTNS
jgi:hypothetical protein